LPCRRFIVSGKVQGVWFRASARNEALALGLSGHALNLADGAVEVVACGEADALDRLAGWLNRGPRLARVDRVTTESIGEQIVQGFEIG
jgi:acylphosphatase